MAAEYLRKIILEEIKKVLNEEVKIPPLSSVKSGQTIEHGVVKDCPGAKELQVLLVKSYPSYQQFMASKESDPLRIRKKLTDGIIGNYFAAAINSIIRKKTGKEYLYNRLNNMETGYEQNTSGYKAICRDMKNIRAMVENYLTPTDAGVKSVTSEPDKKEIRKKLAKTTIAGALVDPETGEDIKVFPEKEETLPESIIRKEINKLLKKL